MTNINQGDIFWIVPDVCRGSAPGPAHPHVVIQEDALNYSRIESVVVCSLTTNLNKSREPGNFLLDAGEGDLPQHSAVIVSQVSAVQKSALGERIGSLSLKRVQQILAGLRFQQASFFRGR